MFNKLQDFKRQGYLLITNLEREDAIKELKHIMNHFPKFESRSGDYSSHTKQFECFYYTLSKEYPKIFLMEMYGIHTLWEYIHNYRQDTLNGNINIYQASIHIYEIIDSLYQSLPNFININEMPSFNLEHKFAPALAADAVKANTKNETVKKLKVDYFYQKFLPTALKSNSNANTSLKIILDALLRNICCKNATPKLPNATKPMNIPSCPVSTMRQK